MSSTIDKHFYKLVETKKNDSSEGVVLDDGEKWIVKDVILEAGYDPQTLACIKFGDSVLISTHGSTSAPFNRSVVGDGVSKVYIFLDNDYNKDIILGGSFTLRKDVSY